MRDDLNLPEQVIRRLEGEHLDLAAPQAGLTCVYQRAALTEERRQTVEMRAADDGTIGIHGYASVTEVPYDVAGGAPYGWVETISRGAFAKSLSERDDVRLLINHEGLPLARTASRTLHLEEDEHGLLSDAPALDLARNPTVQELHSVMDRGDADQMSFAFRVTRQEWDEDYINRRILEVKLYDVSVVTYPANPATVVGLRADAATIDEPAGFPLSLALAQRDQLALRP